MDNLISDTIFGSFDAHVDRLESARSKRCELLTFKSALEDDGANEANPDASQDEVDCLGVWLPLDQYQGDVNYRTLQKLLTRVDQRGFERCALAAGPLRRSFVHRALLPPDHRGGCALGGVSECDTGVVIQIPGLNKQIACRYFFHSS